MKNFLLTIALFTSVSLASCSDSHDDLLVNEPYQAPEAKVDSRLLGEWNSVQYDNDSYELFVLKKELSLYFTPVGTFQFDYTTTLIPNEGVTDADLAKAGIDYDMYEGHIRYYGTADAFNQESQGLPNELYITGIEAEPCDLTPEARRITYKFRDGDLLITEDNVDMPMWYFGETRLFAKAN